MAYAFVGSGQNASNGNTITYSPTAGNYLLVASLTSAGGGSPIASIADNGSGSWVTQKATSQDGSANNDFYTVFTSGACAAGITTITLTYAGGTPGTTDIVVVEYSGLSPTGFQAISAFNQQINPGTGTNAIVSNTVTVSTAPAALIGLIIAPTGDSNITAGTTPISFTLRILSSGSSTLMIEDARVTSTGTPIATASGPSHGAATTYVSYAMAISESGGGGGGTATIAWVS
jgi:hypothetical protein